MPTLRLLAAGPGTAGHHGELLTCRFSPDAAFVLSGGWDGHLRLWESSSCAPVTGVRVSDKPVSACAVSPNGRQWLSGTLDGLLAFWDPMTQQQRGLLLAHTRPISAICYSPSEQRFATASWDGTLALWPHPVSEHEGRTLTGHDDIVAGCRFTPDGRLLVSWSHDSTLLRLWETTQGNAIGCLKGHGERVTAADVAPDSTYVASGARDGVLKLWNLNDQRELHSRKLEAEIKGCFFLPDGETLVSVDAHGRVQLHSVFGLEPLSGVASRLGVQCADLAPAGSQLVLGCDNGRAQFLAIDGMEAQPLLVVATPARPERHTGLSRLFAKRQPDLTFSCTCPACHSRFALFDTLPREPAPCPSCQRRLRFSAATRVMT